MTQLVDLPNMTTTIASSMAVAQPWFDVLWPIIKWILGITVAVALVNLIKNFIQDKFDQWSFVKEKQMARENWFEDIKLIKKKHDFFASAPKKYGLTHKEAESIWHKYGRIVDM